MSIRTRKAIVSAYSEQIRADYATHQLAEWRSGRWYLKKPDTINLWAEVFTLRYGGLLVDGDGGSVIFRASDHTAPARRVAWMASRDSADDRYFVEKASIGSGGRDRVMRFDSVVAVADLHELVDEEPDVRGVIDEFNSDSSSAREDMCEALSEIGLWEEAGDVGMVPTWAMFHAHAVLQRLHCLLSEKAVAS